MELGSVQASATYARHTRPVPSPTALPTHRIHLGCAHSTLAPVLLATFALGGCAHDARLRPRAVRTLAAVGTVTTVAGIVTAAGCPGLEGDPDSCAGSPGNADLAVGIPIAALGAAMLYTAVHFRAKGYPSPLTPRAPLPPPVLPDPFDQPLNPNP